LLIHAPPMPGLLDGAILGSMADGVVLVVEAGATRQHGLRKAAENLATVNVPVLAAILNRRDYPIPRPLYRALFGTARSY
jgi:Mrp family chromosome partitioning ATPase